MNNHFRTVLRCEGTPETVQEFPNPTDALIEFNRLQVMGETLETRLEFWDGKKWRVARLYKRYR